jgi:hypothetical protein
MNAKINKLAAGDFPERSLNRDATRAEFLSKKGEIAARVKPTSEEVTAFLNTEDWGNVDLKRERWKRSATTIVCHADTWASPLVISLFVAQGCAIKRDSDSFYVNMAQPRINQRDLNMERLLSAGNPSSYNRTPALLDSAESEIGLGFDQTYHLVPYCAVKEGAKRGQHIRESDSAKPSSRKIFSMIADGGVGNKANLKGKIAASCDDSNERHMQKLIKILVSDIIL